MPDKSFAQLGVENQLMPHKLALAWFTCACGEIERRGGGFKISLMSRTIWVQIDLLRIVSVDGWNYHAEDSPA